MDFRVPLPPGERAFRSLEGSTARASRHSIAHDATLEKAIGVALSLLGPEAIRVLRRSAPNIFTLAGEHYCTSTMHVIAGGHGLQPTSIITE